MTASNTSECQLNCSLEKVLPKLIHLEGQAKQTCALNIIYNEPRVRNAKQQWTICSRNSFSFRNKWQLENQLSLYKPAKSDSLQKNYILMPDSCFSKSVVRLSTCTLFLAKPSYFHIFILIFNSNEILRWKFCQISIGKLVGGKTKLIHQQFRHRQLGRDTMFPLSYLWLSLSRLSCWWLWWWSLKLRVWGHQMTSDLVNSSPFDWFPIQLISIQLVHYWARQANHTLLLLKVTAYLT